VHRASGERGDSSSSAISPKTWPGPNGERFLAHARHVAADTHFALDDDVQLSPASPVLKNLGPDAVRSSVATWQSAEACAFNPETVGFY